MLWVIKSSVIGLSVTYTEYRIVIVMLSGVMPSFIVVSAVVLNVVFSIAMLCVVMPSVVAVSAIVLNVVAPRLESSN
jgi:hypothetical protein